MAEPRFRLRALLWAFAFLLLSQPFQAALIPQFYIDWCRGVRQKGFDSQSAFVKKEDEQHNTCNLYLVTNRHVVEEHDELAKGGPLWVRFNSTSAGLGQGV